VLDTWLSPLKKVRRENIAELEAIQDLEDRMARLAELKVRSGVETLLSNCVIDEVIRESGLEVYGVIYNIACGKIKDLNVGTQEGCCCGGRGRESGDCNGAAWLSCVPEG